MFRLAGGTQKQTDACLSVSINMVCARVTSHSDMTHRLKYIAIRVLDDVFPSVSCRFRI